jgi:hypothetical protein
LRAHGLRELDHIDQVGGAALGDGPRRLLQDGGQPAGLVAGRRVVVHLHLVAPRVGLPPGNARQQLVGHLATDGAARQQVFAAVDLGRFRQDRGAAMAHQAVHRRAQRRVGADAAVAVGSAALQAHHQVPRRHRLALHAIGLGQQALDDLHALGHGLGRAAACPGC